MAHEATVRPTTIEKLAAAAASSFAMLAGMRLDVFTPLKDGPVRAEDVARAAGLDLAKTAPLLHALVAIGLLAVDGDLFVNTPEADGFLVRGRPEYLGMRHATPEVSAGSYERSGRWVTEESGTSVTRDDDRADCPQSWLIVVRRASATVGDRTSNMANHGLQAGGGGGIQGSLGAVAAACAVCRALHHVDCAWRSPVDPHHQPHGQRPHRESPDGRTSATLMRSARGSLALVCAERPVDATRPAD